MSDKGLPASLDKDGECCYDRLDACGVCGGSGVMRDSFGGCCQVRVMLQHKRLSFQIVPIVNGTE